MYFNTERIYQLLPAVYRIRDSRTDPILDKPLRELINVLAEQAEIVENDIQQLYNNWFIETCDEWLVPYIGDLLGVKNFHPVSAESGCSQRAFIANTIKYRRRKGTAIVLEELAYNITGWRSKVVEFFELLSTTQHFNHVRSNNFRIPDLQKPEKLELINSAFDEASHTADIREINTNKGYYNIDNIGIFLWRIQSYQLNKTKARRIMPRCYTFNQAGISICLFNNPQTEKEITHRAEEINVPGPLRRRPLYNELEQLRKNPYESNSSSKNKYFGVQPVFKVFFGNSPEPLKPEEIIICNLKNLTPSTWPIPKSTSFNTGQSSKYSTKVGIDPELGRLVVLKGIKVPNQLFVNCTYGFSGDIGGGPYNRQNSVPDEFKQNVNWLAGVSRISQTTYSNIYKTLTDAIHAWNKQPAGSIGIISIMDNNTYKEYLTGKNKIKILPGSRLLIIAANMHEKNLPDILPDQYELKFEDLCFEGLRPHILGDLEISAINDNSLSATNCGIFLNGLLIEGKLKILKGNLNNLRVSHCTLVPDKQCIIVSKNNDPLHLDMERSICGQIKVKNLFSELRISESIIDKNIALNNLSIDAYGSDLILDKTTIFGKVKGRCLHADNSIFNNSIEVERSQEGCIRYCYIPQGNNSKLPKCFRCQPQLEISYQLSFINDTQTKTNLENKLKTILIPKFTSTDYGHFGYAQLSNSCPSQIKSGAENGSEMGVFNYLMQYQREKNLRITLDEYLRLGLNAGIIHVT